MIDLFSVAIRTKSTLSILFILLFLLSACSSHEPLTDSHDENEVVTESESRDYSELEALYWSRIEESRMSFVQADVDFMTDMISHHAQALIMSNLAPKNGASHSVQTLASRIHNAQQDEIATMQKWLRDRSQPVPEVHIEGLILMVHVEEESSEMDHGMMDHDTMDHDTMNHDAMDHEEMGHSDHDDDMMHAESDMESSDHHMSGHSMHHHDMPGMLTQEQLEELAAATGREFDWKFLRFMIEHHEGAVFMVNELFESDGAANDNEIFDLASDIHVEQITEINRMKLMLEEIEEELAGF